MYAKGTLPTIYPQGRPIIFTHVVRTSVRPRFLILAKKNTIFKRK